MPFDMYGDVILPRDVTQHGLRPGDVGTVVQRHVVARVADEGYSVELFDMTGNNESKIALLDMRSWGSSGFQLLPSVPARAKSLQLVLRP